jgi:tRNA A-37 threonylcarbamoyl transferase component Bud32
VRLVSPDALSDSERAVFELYARSFPASAVCVNVLIGDSPWDIRPLVLSKSRVWLYRYSRSFDEASRQSLIAEIQGFTVIPSWDTTIAAVADSDRFVLIRPYVQSTLKDLLLRGELPVGHAQLPLARKIIEQVRALEQRNLVHGHISLSNITLLDERVVFLDPRIGALNGTTDEYLAPELRPEDEPQHAADLYSLGRTLKVILGDALSERQRALVDQLLLPSPRQRPALESLEQAFSSKSGDGPPVAATGRVLGAKQSSPRDDQGPSSPISSAPSVNRAPLSLNFGPPKTRPLLVALVAAIALLALLRYRAPAVYFTLARYVPLPASTESSEHEADWGSGDRVRMRRVARAAVLDRDPAAQNAIIESILDGKSPPGIPADLLRTGLNPLWRDQLSHTDQDTVLALTLAPLLPEGTRDSRRFSELAAPIILAIACHMSPANPNKELDAVSLETIEELPAPVGPAFRYLRESGVQKLSAPEAIGLSAIACGQVTATALDAYFGRDSDTNTVLARMANAFPLLGSNEESARQMLASLRDKGGDIGTVLGWFDIDDLARWSTIPSFEKLALILNQFPIRQLTLSQYSDLLTFPLAGVRKQSAEMLATRFFKPDDRNLFTLLSGERAGLTREQTLALVAALSLPQEKRVPFVAAWFETKPSPEAVVLILLARAQADSSDLLNLEAARYLRKNEWRSSLDILQLMARHPEPLARSMAYSKLNPQTPSERAVLQESLTREKDSALKRVVQLRLGIAAEGVESAEAAPTATPNVPRDSKDSPVPAKSAGVDAAQPAEAR